MFSLCHVFKSVSTFCVILCLSRIKMCLISMLLSTAMMTVMYRVFGFGFKGNKGAVGVSFMFNGTSFGFVNCHLTSGNEKIARYQIQ